jgi:5-methylcytosine-specific restriction endonuclease McrA
MVKRLSYTEQLNTPEWAAKRLKIFKRDGYKCQTCGSKKGLQCHHKKYIKGKMAWEVPDVFLETVCEPCHREIHKDTHINVFIAKDKAKRKRQMKAGKKAALTHDGLRKTLSRKDRALQARYDNLKVA